MPPICIEDFQEMRLQEQLQRLLSRRTAELSTLTENRRYNVREIARIQTFPDEFVFFTEDPKSVTGMYKVIGNAVPPT